MRRCLIVVLAAMPAFAQSPAPFEVTEATIAQTHDAIKAGRLTCRQLVKRLLQSGKRARLQRYFDRALTHHALVSQTHPIGR